MVAHLQKPNKIINFLKDNTEKKHFGVEKRKKALWRVRKNPNALPQNLSAVKNTIKSKQEPQRH